MEDPDDVSASCKPFAKNRSGLVLGEGAAMVVLESWERAESRGARIHAELAGYGLSMDAEHITRPTVAGQACAMTRALESARMSAGDVGYVNAHGTATMANDAVETAAIKQVFGPGAYALPVSSTKSMHGHLLGAAGALELAATVLAIEKRVLPPTLHLVHADPECDLDYVAGICASCLHADRGHIELFCFWWHQRLAGLPRSGMAVRRNELYVFSSRLLWPSCSGPLSHPQNPSSCDMSKGSSMAFSSLRSPEGGVLATAISFRTRETIASPAVCVFHFEDGSLHDETAVFSQRGHFQLISYHLVQKGPAFERPLDMMIDCPTGHVMVRYENKHGEEKVEDEHMDLPADLANGLIPSCSRMCSETRCRPACRSSPRRPNPDW